MFSSGEPDNSAHSSQEYAEFNVDATVTKPRQWPEEYREVFTTIYEISKLSFEDYRRAKEDGGSYTPWRADNLQTAKSIVARV